MLLVIDNYDSFTYNLVQYFGELGAEPLVKRNDEITPDEIAALKPARICISPGPCTPNEAGISCEVIRRFGPTTPLLGVCLGHQSIGHVYGGDVVRAGRLMHGKTSPIHHKGTGVFGGLPSPFEATRFLRMATPQTEVLITVAGAERGRYIFEPGEYIVGRNPDCHIPVEADLVSRRHAKLTLNFDNAFIEDLGSSNGTQVNGQPVA